MRAFGYIKANDEQETPVELREATFILPENELDAVISFLQYARNMMNTSKMTAGQSHLHLRDWWGQWTQSQPDLIIVYDGME